MSTHESTTSPLVLDLQYHPIAGVWTQTVDARKLYESLEVESRFNDWINNRIQEYGFLEGADFLFYLKISKTPGRPLHQYFLTLDMAKELCMVERSPRGRQARQYFIACEQALHSGAFAQVLERIEARLVALEGQGQGAIVRQES